jgi:cytochrome d ubiquinol oxidase subunit I
MFDGVSLNPLLLSRLQFAWVIGWHIMLPTFTVGLASYIALLEILHLATGREVYFRISAFWTKIFAVAFGMGVVTGVVMPFQFGTNWSRYSYATADVLSPLFAYEGLTAFFLEAAFLGVLLFGRNLVPRWAHCASACMVAAGTLFSSFWILAANSWMQTPAGATLVNGRFEPTDWLAIIFNPSFPTRLGHTVIGFYITTAFVVLSVAAGYLLRERFVDEARRMLSMTLWLLLIFVPLQIFLGDASGLVTEQYQPAKLAAIEGDWQTRSRMPLTLFGIPDQKDAVNHAAIEIPVAGSLILKRDPNGTVVGLDHFPRSDWPPVIVVFFSFRIMVGIGFLMLAIVLAGNALRRHGRIFSQRMFLQICRASAPIGFIAVLAGWVTTEVGRQPWTVYGLLRTADSVTPSLTGWNVALSFAGYAITYLIIYPSGLLVMAYLVRRGPSDTAHHAPIEGGQPRSPTRPVPETAGDVA